MITDLAVCVYNCVPNISWDEVHTSEQVKTNTYYIYKEGTTEPHNALDRASHAVLNFNSLSVDDVSVRCFTFVELYTVSGQPNSFGP